MHSIEKHDDNRRGFIAKVVAVVAGGIALLVPLTSGLTVFFSPLWRKGKSPRVRVALLSQVPDDGIPRFFPVQADREDAWNRYPQQRIGAVYLVRQKGERQPIAFAAKCPHAGCFIGHTPGADKFRCPCHTSQFNLDGTRVNGDNEVAPRDMDRLPVELVVNGSADGQSSADTTAVEVWVEYIEFQTGSKEQIRAV